MSKVVKNLKTSLFEGLNVFKYSEAIVTLWHKYRALLLHYLLFAVLGSALSWVVFVNQRLLAVTAKNLFLYWISFFIVMMSYLVATLFHDLASPRARKPLFTYWWRGVVWTGYLFLVVMIMTITSAFGGGMFSVGWETGGLLGVTAGGALLVASLVLFVSFILPTFFGLFFFMTGESFRDGLLRGGSMLWHHWTFLVGLILYNYLLQVAIDVVLNVVVLGIEKLGLPVSLCLPWLEWHSMGLAHLFFMGVVYLFFNRKKRYISAF
ncbi:MAG: hypothetical protein PVJ92_01705 [Candidatus Dependentiae bacterium]|jgi:hypothetical protein